MLYLITCAFDLKLEPSYLNRHTDTMVLINVII